MVVPDAHHISEDQHGQHHAAGRLTTEDHRQQRNGHHACPMDTGLGHAHEEGDQRDDQQLIRVQGGPGEVGQIEYCFLLDPVGDFGLDSVSTTLDLRLVSTPVDQRLTPPKNQLGRWLGEIGQTASNGGGNT